MIIYLNSDGTIESVYPKTLTQGSNNTSSITLICPSISQFSSVSIDFVLPDGTQIAGGVMLPQDQLSVNNELLNAYTYEVKRAITNIPGILGIAFKVTDVNSGVVSSYLCNVEVVRSLAPTLPEEPSIDWYEEVLEAYAYLIGLVEELEHDIADVNYVKYVEQELTEEQQAQARENIGAASKNYEELNNKPSINSVPLVGNKSSSQLGLQPTISDLSTIRSNAQYGLSAYNTIAGYGNIVVYNASDFATAAQGALADSALQPSDVDNVLSTESANPVQNRVIAVLIPAQANAGNQLADKAFVNSTVQTNTANFRGNWATWAAVPTSANSYPVDYSGSKTPTVNDYMVVQDASGYTEEALEGTWRFKYAGIWSVAGKSGWLPEYQVNETPLTAAQLAALNSGITSDLVTQIGTNTSDISSLSTNKQDKLTAGTDISIVNNVISYSGSALTVVKASDVDSESATSGQVLTADGSGGASWQTPSGGGGGGTSDYDDLDNKPLINNVVLSGSLSLSDLGIEPEFSKNTAFNKNFETSTTNIKMNGSVSVGSSNNVARADHVHPSDTSKADVATTVTAVSYDSTNKKITVTINSNTTDVVTFGANAFTDTAIPTSDSDLTNNRYVRYDTNAQGLNDTQKANVRTNIGAGTSNFDGAYSSLTGRPTLGTAAALDTGTSQGNIPLLGTNGKLPSSVIPASAITDTFVVNSQAAMLALSSAEVGDVCIRTDISTSFILRAEPYSTLSNWEELLTPTSPVLSVNNQTGVVVLTASDVGAEPSFSKNTAFNKNFETSTPNIKMNGSVSVGSLDTVARADHIHPSDTSKQDVIDSSHKLSADLVDDTSTTNKFVTASDKTEWNGKQDGTITGSGAPTTSTVGTVGQLYIDTSTDTTYQCMSIDTSGVDPVYTWSGLAGSVTLDYGLMRWDE